MVRSIAKDLSLTIAKAALITIFQSVTRPQVAAAVQAYLTEVGVTLAPGTQTELVDEVVNHLGTMAVRIQNILITDPVSNG